MKSKFLNTGHSLLSNVTRLWLPRINPTAAGGLYVPSFGVRGAQAKLVGLPTWRSTPYGLGIATDNLKYADLEPLSWFIGSYAVSYLYRYDASGSQETGILISDGSGGHALRHKGNTVELLKSHSVSILSANVGQPNTDVLCTAAFSVGWGATATVNLFFNGLQIATALTNQGMSVGTTTTALGMDFASPNEFGRHTLLAAAFWNNQPLTAQMAWLWHETARASFNPLFARRIFAGDGLFHAAPDLTGAATAGFGLGASAAPVELRGNTLAGLAMGASTEPEPYVTQGFSLGSRGSPVELFGRMVAGMIFGSVPDEDKEAIAGIGLGSRATLDGQYANAAAGFGLGARMTSDSGDLASGRYRR
jgi:hypothetical protein